MPGQAGQSTLRSEEHKPIDCEGAACVRTYVPTLAVGKTWRVFLNFQLYSFVVKDP